MEKNGKREVAEDDHVGASDNSRNGLHHRPQPLSEDAGGIAEADAALTAAAEDFLSAHGVEANDPELVRQIALAVEATGWAGPLPPPHILEQYDEKTKDHIIAWSDAQINGGLERARYIAETERVAIEADSRATARNQWLSTIINAAFLGCALFAFVLTDGNPASFGFLAVPGMTIAVNVIGSVRRPK